jgi:hypothetical protein
MRFPAAIRIAAPNQLFTAEKLEGGLHDKRRDERYKT